MKNIFASIFGIALLFLMSTTVFANAEAAPYYGFGTTNGRTDTINIQDYHTNSWERFIFNYLFESGSNYRYDLGRPTTFTGQVPVDVYSVNVRRDKNVTFQPPSYGVFSGNVATPPSNYLFDMPLDPAFIHFLYQAFQADPNVEARFDTLMQGVNMKAMGNPMEMYNVGQQGTLPSNSIGGSDVFPIGGSSAPSSNVTSEFLPPTSILD